MSPFLPGNASLQVAIAFSFAAPDVCGCVGWAKERVRPLITELMTLPQGSQDQVSIAQNHEMST